MAEHEKAVPDRLYLVQLTGAGLVFFAIYMTFATTVGAAGKEWESVPAAVFMMALYGMMLHDFLAGRPPLSVRVLEASFLAFVASFSVGKVVWHTVNFIL